MTDSNINRKRSKIFLLAALLISVVINVALLFDRAKLEEQKQEYITEIEATQESKDSLIDAYTNLYQEYEGLKTSNDTLNLRLSDEQTKIKELLEEIKNIKGANSDLIKKYEKELATLRQVMRSFIVQIDSLHTMNQNLISENEKIKSNFSEQQNQNQELSEKNEKLSKTVAKASELKAVGITVLGLNTKDKETPKADKIGKIEVCCQLSENNVASKGRKSIYVRIARPDGIILSKSPDNRFNYGSDQILYSTKRDVEYNGEQISMCIYWLNDEILIAGKYTIEIYEGGTKIGTSFLDLK